MTQPTDAAGTPLIETNAVIIGAGPVGLFQVFELGLLEIGAHVIDSLPVPGGQCIELYPDKPIYDIPGLPRSTGRELIGRLMQQIQPFGATFHLGQEVSTLQRQPDGRLLVATQAGTRLLAKTVFIAGGVGSFQPRRLKVDGLEAFEGRQVFHHLGDPTRFAGQHVVVHGGDEATLDWVLKLSELGPLQPASIALVHRRDVFQAEPQSVARLRERVAAGRVQLVIGQITGVASEADHLGDRLTGLRIAHPDASTRTLPLDTLLVCLGLSPKLGPIAQWGLAMERKQLVVNTETFATSEPGIFAVGDVNTYPGKKKLILCGFHEATLAAFGAAAIVRPDDRVQLQYTTTSPRLHQLLGVEGSPSSPG